MAEPIILAYGRGSIPEFPGHPRGHRRHHPGRHGGERDAGGGRARRPSRGARLFHVSSGSRNPLRTASLYRYVRATSRRTRCRSVAVASARCPSGSSPGSRRVERSSTGGEADRRGREGRSRTCRGPTGCASWVSRVDRERARLEFVRRYADLYGAYTETEVIYTDDRMLSTVGLAHGRDRREFPFDSAIVDWRVLPPGRALPGGDQRHRGLSRRERQSPAVQDRDARPTGWSRCSTWRGRSSLERRRVLPLAADGRASARRGPRELVQRLRAAPTLRAERPAGPGRVPADLLPAVRGRLGRRGSSGWWTPRRRVHAAEGQLRRRSAGSASTAPPVTARSSSRGAEMLRPAARARCSTRDRVRAQVRDGRYTGFMVITAARRRGARRLAASLRGAEGVDLKQSYAYAD